MTKTKVVHCKKDEYDVMIDRTTKWGNPYHKHYVITKDDAIKLGAIHKEGFTATKGDRITLYEYYLRNNKELLDDIENLRGLRLGCWCKPGACHGDVIVKILMEKEDVSLFTY